MKQLLPLFTTLLTLLLTACGDDPIPDPPERGYVCVTALDQDDQPMMGCEFEYETPDSIFDEEVDYNEMYGDPGTFGHPEDACKADPNDENSFDKLLVYNKPGRHVIPTRCGTLTGYLDVDLDEGENEDYSSRVIDSFCTDGVTFETDYHHNTVELQDHLGFSTDLMCSNWLTEPERLKTEVVKMSLDCSNPTDCDGLTAEDLLEIEKPEVGWTSQGVAQWLKLTAQTHLVPDGEERTVIITIRQESGPQQEMDIPILIHAPMCGNGIIEYREDCEGEVPNGLSCEYYGFDGGSLSCDQCQVNKDSCYFN